MYGSLRLGGIAIGSLLLLALVALVVAGLYQTRRVERNQSHRKFQSGTLPEPLPDGFLKGNTFTGLGRDWRGKVFDRAKQTGINRFGDGQRYAFRTYPAAGLRDQDVRVLSIDYNQPGNPLWLRFIVDEIVETSPGHYLGKVHLKVIPGLPFSLTYFELSVPDAPSPPLRAI